MRRYRQLYDIEESGKSMSPKDRLALRQNEARPIWEAMEMWLEEVQLRTTNVILPKSDLAAALPYVRNHFVQLRRSLDDPRLPCDNSSTEQLMKQVAVGRKNCLFAGSVLGGMRIAGFSTFVRRMATVRGKAASHWLRSPLSSSPLLDLAGLAQESGTHATSAPEETQAEAGRETSSRSTSAFLVT